MAEGAETMDGRNMPSLSGTEQCLRSEIQWMSLIFHWPLEKKKKGGGGGKGGRKRENEGSQFPCRASELREHHQNANPAQAHSSQSPWEGADGAEIPQCPTGHLQPKGKASQRGRAGEAL